VRSKYKKIEEELGPPAPPPPISSTASGKDKLKTVNFAVLDQLRKQLEIRHSE